MSHKSLHRAADANRAAQAVALRRAALQRVWPDGTRARPCADTPAVLPISEERAAYALQAADVGIWEIDLRTEGLACSETIASLLGVKLGNPPRTAAEFIAQVHPDDRPAMKAFLLGPKRVGVDYHAEFRVLRPEGGPRWMASRARLFPDDTGRPVRLLGIATDIDDRRMLALQLGRAQKIESVGQLTAGLVHDFNNLLTVILAYSGLVMGTLEPGDPRCADMEQVMKAGHQAGGLTRQLLAFIRKQGGKPTTLDLNILVANMLEMLS
ncbi:MAG: PAS domain-containing protein, partial [Acidobacteriota bacterium]